VQLAADMAPWNWELSNMLKWPKFGVPLVARVGFILPIVMLALVFTLTDRIRLAAGLSDMPLLSLATTPQLDDWGKSLVASSHDSAARLGWAAALAVFACLWGGTIVACVGTLRRVSDPKVLGWLIAVSVVAAAVFILALHAQEMAKALKGVGEHLALAGLLVLALAFIYRAQRTTLLGMALLLIGVMIWVVQGWPLAEWAGAVPVANAPSRQLAMVAPPFDSLLLQIGTQCASPQTGPCLRGLFGLDRVVGGFALIAVALLALAATALMAEDPLGSPDGIAAERGLARQQDELQRLLYLAAGLLVMSVLFAKSYQQWPLSVVHDPSLGSALQLIADQWIMMTGTYWTLILVSIFLPIGLVLIRRCDALAELRCGSVSPKALMDWLKAGGFKSSLKEQFLTVFSLLSPWLAGGPLAALLGALKTTGT
jgi:hypothetical protein